ncbi:FecR family protein [Deminuibacter soli]|uniref:FecR family protein n=1 Tax=Deminuibacter soli TaxID=2291815 RepID=A0A3E1NJ23_9BACT|nr:FecR domain-containing protein [Deminuibacter soli]RFM27824.1 FecR family protein [Deminuibacter soli]
MLSQELVSRYLLQQCTVAEAHEVEALLREDAGALDRLLPESEAAADKVRLHPAVSQQIWNKVQLQVFPKKVHTMKWLRMAAAAVLLAAMGILLLWQQKAPAPVAVKPVTQQQPGMAALQNSSDKPQRFTMPDGSMVELAPNSIISFEKNFTGNTRTVQLTGKALFNVISNADKPFSVHAGNLVTTVLGTAFSIAAFPESKLITIQLLTGKIVVTGTHLAHAVYLQPGEVLTYDKKSMTASVNNAGATGKTPQLRDTVTTPGIQQQQPVSQPDWYAFHGQPLPQVLNQLSAYYGVVISYDPAELANTNFFGSFRKSDDIDKIIHDIALLNGLTVSRQDGRYLVRKHP